MQSTKVAPNHDDEGSSSKITQTRILSKTRRMPAWHLYVALGPPELLQYLNLRHKSTRSEILN